MSIQQFIWLVTIYAGTVILGYIVKHFFFKLKIDRKKEFDDLNRYYNLNVLITITLWIPVFNLVMSYLLFKMIYDTLNENKERKQIHQAADGLKEHFKNAEPELKNKIEEIADMMKKL